MDYTIGVTEDDRIATHHEQDEHPIVHALLMGMSGVGKTQLAATFPKPMLVHFWDGFGNDQPFLNIGEVQPLQYWDDGTPWREVMTPEGVITIEYYHDIDPTNPQAFDNYLANLRHVNPKEWSTIVFDSVSEAVKSARWAEQFKHQKAAKDQRLWWGPSADHIERIITGTFKAYPCNTVVTAHLADKLPREDAPFWPLDLPGRLSTALPKSFGEALLLRITLDEKGNRQRVIQTESDEKHFAKSHLSLPMYVESHYNALWEGDNQHISVKKVVNDRVRTSPQRKAL